jgi:hypothetical protein
MEIYDPEVGPSADEWLSTDEAERITLVKSWHHRRGIRVPRMTLHATVHVVVENQIALGEPGVIDTLARLRAEGLTRHDAVHAVGLVLTEHIYDLLNSTSPTTTDLNGPYLDRLRRLTAAEWLRSGQ